MRHERQAVRSKESTPSKPGQPVSLALDSLRGVADLTSDAIFLKDLDGHYLYVNPIGLAWAQARATDLAARNPLSRLGMDEIVNAQLDERVRREGGAESVEWTCLSDELRPRFRMTKSPFRDANGTVFGILEVVHKLPPQHDANQTLRTLAIQSSLTGESYLKSIVTTLCELCRCDLALVGEIQPRNDSVIRTIALARDGMIVDNIEYSLHGTPCERVVQHRFCHIPQDVQREFPDDDILRDLRIEAYMGIPLFSASGRMLGHIALLGKRPFTNAQAAENVLRVVATRAGAELERRQSEGEWHRRLFELSVLNAVGRVCAEAETFDEVITKITQLIAESLYPENCGFLLLQDDGRTLVPHSTFVASEPTVDLSPVSIDHGVVGRTARTGKVQRLGDVRKDPDYWSSDPRTRSELCLPLRVGGKVVGVVNIESSVSDAFSEADERMMIAVVDFAASTWTRLLDAARRRASEEMLNEAQAIGHLGSFEWDVRQNRLEWSDELLRIYGLRREDFRGSVDDFISRLVPEDRDMVATSLQRVMQEGTEFHFQERIVRPDGEIRVLESQGKVFRDAEGAPIRLAGVCQDITERRKAEDALLASEERFSKLFHHSPFSIMLATYPEGIIIEANDAFLKPWEFERDEVVGKSTEDLHVWENPADRQAVVDEIRRSRRFENGEFWFRSKSGKRRLKLLSIEIIEVQGQTLSLAMSIDITDRRLAEESLQKTARLLQAVSEGTTDAVFVKDENGKYLFFNEAAARFVGMSVEDVLGRDDRDLFDAESAEFLMRKDRSLFESGIVETSEETITAAGVTRTYLATKGPYRDHQGKIVGTIGISRDISERKQIESALKTSEERYRMAVRATNDAIWDVDLTTGVFSWNEHYEAVFGRPVDPAASWDWWIEHVHAEDRTRVAESINEALIGDAQFWNCDYRQLRLDGVWADIHDRAFIARDEEGRAIRIVGAMQDVTAVKQAANELQATQRMVQLVAEASPLTIYVFDLNQKAVIYSNYRVVSELGYRLSDVQSWGPEEMMSLVHPDDLQQSESTFDRWAELPDGTILDSEYRLRDAEGSWHWIVVRDTVFARSADGRVSQIVGTVQDITERKILEQQFRESQKMEAIGRLAGGIAHDFNNLLTIINGYCHLLLHEQSDDDPCRNSVVQIRDAGERAAQLTRQLLSFSRRALIDPKVLDLNDVVNNSESLLRRLIGEQIELRLDLTSDKLPIRIDSSQMDQVLMNLSINARDAIVGRGSLVIATALVTDREINLKGELRPAVGRYAQLSVSDTGHGVKPELMNKIFEPFFTTKERGKGTGLGLAVVYGIVQQSGGQIHVASELDRGTTFTLWFPVESERERGFIDKRPESADHGPAFILVVEDDAGVRRLVRDSLEADGHRVLLACDAADALRQFKEHGKKIDLLISDLIMPGMTGIELVHVLRKRNPQLPVLYVSGYNQIEDFQEWKSDARATFLQKPFSPDALRNQLGRLRRAVAERPGS